MERTMRPTVAEADRMLAAARAKAQAMNLSNVAISIVDARGDLVAMIRLDNAIWRTAPVSRGKAFASAAFGAPTGTLQERADMPVMRALMLQEEGLLIPQQGAVPIMKDGVLIGAIGVSGAASSEDEEIAAAGVAAL